MAPGTVIAFLEDENTQLKTTVAELVALLRMGKELAEAAGDATFYSGEKMKRAIADRDRILGQYDEAIAEHGGWAMTPDENERLRERLRELAKGYLRALLTLVCDRSRCTETTAWRSIKTPQPGSVSETLLKLAEEAGVWFDDQGNEVPLDKWRARMGGETA